MKFTYEQFVINNLISFNKALTVFLNNLKLKILGDKVYLKGKVRFQS